MKDFNFKKYIKNNPLLKEDAFDDMMGHPLKAIDKFAKEDKIFLSNVYTGLDDFDKPSFWEVMEELVEEKYGSIENFVKEWNGEV